MKTQLRNRSALMRKIAKAKFEKTNHEDLEQFYINFYVDYFQDNCNDDDLIQYARHYGVDYEEEPA
jgi:hypothetical protein